MPKLQATKNKSYVYLPNNKNGIFENITETNLSIKPKDIPKLIKARKASKKNSLTTRALGIKCFKDEEFTGLDPKFIWYGHSVLLLHLEGKTS